MDHEHERARSAGELSSQIAPTIDLRHCFIVLSKLGQDRMHAFGNPTE